jgi:serine protease Do
MQQSASPVGACHVRGDSPARDGRVDGYAGRAPVRVEMVQDVAGVSSRRVHCRGDHVGAFNRGAGDICALVRFRGGRGWLGVGIQNLTKELKEYYGMKDGEGVLITQVFPDDPAAKAGIEPNDIILEINGRKVKTSRELSRMIAETSVGQKVDIVVLRKGSKKQFNVQLSKREDMEIASRNDEIPKKNELGIAVSNLPPEVARKFNLKDTEGVVVVGVDPDSKGEKAGILTGDIIKEINHEDVDNVDEYSKEIGKIKSGETIYMYILRPNRGFMAIKLIK